MNAITMIRRALTRRGHEKDPLLEFFETAPVDDEPTTPDEDASAREAWEQRGDSISLEEFRRSYP